MPHVIPTFEELREDYLREVRNIDHEADIGEDSDHYIRASATASLVHGLYHDHAYILCQFFEDSCDPEFLEIHAGKRGLTLKPATFASGTMQFSGNAGSAVSAGITFKHEESGLSVVTTAGGTVGEDGKLTLSVRAISAGEVSRLEDAPVVFNSPPPGVSEIALLSIRGGTNAETHAQLLERLLFRMRHPNGGGNKYDFESWAMEVPGVSSARCIPHRRALGTVDVLITSAGDLPSDEIINNTQAHLETKRPVPGKDVLVLAPLPYDVDVNAGVAVSSGTIADLNQAAFDAVSAVFAGIKPGMPLIRGRLEAAIFSLAAVEDCRIISPAANIIPNDIGWPRLKSLTLVALSDEGEG